MKDGLKILLKTYWCSNGWKDGTISKEDFELAKKQGYMFDYPPMKSHDEILKKVKETASKINREDIANAFLYSLSTRKLEYRSALGSYYFATSIPEHTLEKTRNQRVCHICGWSKWYEKPNEIEQKHGLNVFNFERYKFGGVRQCHLDYVLFDLEQFMTLPKVKPTKEDKGILNKILDCINKMNPQDKAGKLRELIIKEKILKGNKNEVSVILDLLGICGILCSAEFPSYEDRFVDEFGRAPVESKNDFLYPVNRWHAKDGVDKIKFEKVFHYKYK